MYGAEILPRLRARFGLDGSRERDGRAEPGWAVIIPVKPTAVGKSRLERADRRPRDAGPSDRARHDRGRGRVSVRRPGVRRDR